MEKLDKSLAELDALAEEMLMKSQAAEGKEKDEDITPEEVSDDTAQSDADNKEEADKPEAEEADKEKDDTEDEEENVEKSEEVEPVDNAGDEGDEPTSEEMEKSFQDNFQDNENISKGIEASEFLGAMVEILSKSMGDIQYDVMSGHKNQSAANTILAKSLQASLAMNNSLRDDNAKLARRITKLEKSLDMGFEKIMDSLDEISSQPATMRKSLASMNIQDRNFGASIQGNVQKGGFEALNKSQVMGILTSEMYAGNPSVTTSDIIGYESGAPLRQDLQQLVASKSR